jgi:hypothetical protein
LHVFESVQVPSWVRVSHGHILCLCLLVGCILPLGLLRGELLCLLVVALVPLVPLRATTVTPLRVPPTCCLGGSLCSTLAVFGSPLSSVRLHSWLLTTISGCRLSSKVLFSLSGHRLPPKVFFTLSGCRLYPKLLPGTRGTPGHPTGPLVRRTPQLGHPIVGSPRQGREGSTGHPTAPSLFSPRNPRHSGHPIGLETQGVVRCTELIKRSTSADYLRIESNLRPPAIVLRNPV